MNGFPNVDPIPLPAPIWLFKLLHIVTLSLHFVAMEILVGGLLIAVLLNIFGRSVSAATAASAISRRLTIVMTYVINLGVPPLLFAQVLYGRAIYTSSVMIGLRWIAVIPALILAYWLLYRFAAYARSRQQGMVDRPHRVDHHRRHRTCLLHQHDSDASSRSLAKHVLRLARSGRISPQATPPLSRASSS